MCDSDEEITAVVTERVSKARAHSHDADDPAATPPMTTTTTTTTAAATNSGSLGGSGHHPSSSFHDDTVQSAHDSSSDIATLLPATTVQSTNLLRHTSSDAGGVQANTGSSNNNALQRTSSGAATVDKRQRARSVPQLKATSGGGDATTTTGGGVGAAGEDSLVVARRRAVKERHGPKDRLLDNSEYIAKQHGSSGSGDEEGDELLDVRNGGGGGRKRTLTRGRKPLDPKLATPTTATATASTSTTTTTTTATTPTSGGGGGGAIDSDDDDDDDDLDRNTATTTTTNSHSLRDMLLSQSSEKLASSLRAGAAVDDDDELAMTLRVSVPHVNRIVAFDVSVDNTPVDVLRVVRERLPHLPPPASGNAFWLQQSGGAICPMHKSLLELRVMPHELLTLVERPGVDVTVARGAELMRKLNELDRVVQEHNQRELAAEIHAALESSRGPSPQLLSGASIAASGTGSGSGGGGGGGGSNSPSNLISAAAIASIAATQQGTLKRVRTFYRFDRILY